MWCDVVRRSSVCTSNNTNAMSTTHSNDLALDLGDVSYTGSLRCHGKVACARACACVHVTVTVCLHFYRANAYMLHATHRTVVAICLSIHVANAWFVTKRKHLAIKSANMKSTTSFPMSLTWTATLALTMAKMSQNCTDFSSVQDIAKFTGRITAFWGWRVQLCYLNFQGSKEIWRGNQIFAKILRNCTDFSSVQDIQIFFRVNHTVLASPNLTLIYPPGG